MAFSVNSGGSRSRRGGRGGAPLAEINVTPFVDVVLVLLIIFMLTAHVMEYGLQVDVPKTRYVRDTAQELPVISITKDGTLFVNEKATNINDLASAVQQKFGKAKAVYLSADKETIYDVVAQVADELGHAGLQVNLVTQPIDETGKGRSRRK
jgi:biopolymer transport protein ExbD